MRYESHGSTYSVTVSAAEVEEWNRRWPCSTLTGRQRFAFDRRDGSLVEHRGKGDGEEAAALSRDAQEWAENRTKGGA